MNNVRTKCEEKGRYIADQIWNTKKYYAQFTAVLVIAVNYYRNEGALKIAQLIL